MVDVLCATEFLSQARAAKVNNVEGGTEGQAEFPGDQKRYPGRGESGWPPRGDATELEFDGVSAWRKGEEKMGRSFQVTEMAEGKDTGP